MAQYTPRFEAKTEVRYSEISRALTREEYRGVVGHAWSLGLERLEYNERGV